MRRRQSLAAFGAPAFQHDPAIFGGHARSKTVRLGAPAIVWLKGSLRHSDNSPTKGKDLA
jgi:hypothetical protein